jgi:hypothetical protein
VLVDGVPAALALGALTVYGVLIAGYSQFYAELGVRPTEVGLVFAPALGGIAGTTVVLVPTHPR